MSHEIDMSNGRANMAFVGEVPWHGLGSKLTPGASFDVWKKEAGLDFHVERSGLTYFHAGRVREHPTRDTLLRDDNGNSLGIVGKDYRVVQPEQVISFFKDLSDIGGFEMETAGSLFGGQRVWGMAKINDGAPIIGQDVVRPYILMTTSFDGSSATIAKLSYIRAVCNNTLSAAITRHDEKANKKKGAARLAVRVPHSATWDATQARIDLGIVKDEWEKFLFISRRMAETKMSGYDADQILRTVFSIPEDDGSDDKIGYKTVMELFEGRAIGSDMTQGRSVWQFVNAVTEYVDHHKGRLQDNRLRNAWFGAGDTMKSNAFAMAAELVSSQ